VPTAKLRQSPLSDFSSVGLFEFRRRQRQCRPTTEMTQQSSRQRTELAVCESIGTMRPSTRCAVGARYRAARPITGRDVCVRRSRVASLGAVLGAPGYHGIDGRPPGRWQSWVQTLGRKPLGAKIWAHAGAQCHHYPIGARHLLSMPSKPPAGRTKAASLGDALRLMGVEIDCQ